MKYSAFGFFLTLTALASMAYAQNYDGRSVSAVDISGLERVSDQVVRSKIEVQPGQAYNPRAISRDIRRLYDLGYFATIRADAAADGAGVRITYIVEEKRVIDEIRIVGADKIKERRVLGVLSYREGDSFIPESFNQERQAVLDLYESKGYANVTVDIVAEKVGPSRVRLIYSVDEGSKARIRSVEFVGNETLGDRRLKKLLKTKPAWWFLGGKYDEGKFEYDLEKVIEEYGNHGRLEANIPKTDILYTDSGRGMNITVYLQEGPQYRVDTLDIADNSVFDDDEVLGIAEVKSGDIHNKGQVVVDARAIEQGYQDSGYVNANVTPQVSLDRETKTTHVVQKVDEGDLKYVREIQITGNAVTKDEVIRREMALNPGERYDGSAREESERRLENTEYFEDVRLTLDDVEGDDMFTNVVTDVEEGKTGSWTGGAGYGSEDGANIFTELSLNNFDIANWPTFSGGGQQLFLRLSLGSRRNEYNLSFTEPQFLGYPISFGADLFDQSYKVRGGAEYKEEEKGGQLRFGKVLSPYVTVRASFRFEDTYITELPFFVNRELRDQRGSRTTLSTRWQIERNTLDRYKDPSRGAKHVLNLEVAGFGGDNEFVKIEHDSTWYRPLTADERWILSFRTREGWMTEYGDSESVPLQDRFYAGGTTTVRGYDNRDIGPQLREFGLFGDKFRVGGEARLVNNLEVKYKLTDMVRIYGFADAGGVWESGVDFGEMKYSVGMGIGVDVPRLGPVRFDYGYPLNPDEDQGSGRLHFLTGIRF